MTRFYRARLPAGAEEAAQAAARELFAEGAVAVEREGDAVLGWFVRAPAIEAAEAPAPEWAAEWLAQHGAIVVSDRLALAPSFVERPHGDRIVLSIDPGLAFGTGTHATTVLCLQLLEPLAPGRRVLDFGTGTGVLAVAALELGAASAVGVDNDAVALRTAARVARDNGVAVRLLERAPAERFELVLANLPVEAQESLAPAVGAAASRDLILSGFLEGEPIERLYPGFAVKERRARGGWAALHLARVR